MHYFVLYMKGTCIYNVLIHEAVYHFAFVCFLIVGGDTKYFEKNIMEFNFTESVFDIAMLAIVKTVAQLIVMASLEESSSKLIESPFDHVLQKQVLWLHIAVKLIPFSCLTFGIVKDALVLNSLLNDSHYEVMSATYNAVCISFVCLTFLELVLGLWSGHAMRRLQLVRILHQFNEMGQELNSDGRVIQKKPGLLKLFSLAKEVMWTLQTVLSSKI